MNHTLKWFQNRIGKRIFRDERDCKCPVCVNNEKYGLRIHDEQHARYLYEVQENVNYRDRK